MKHTAPTRTTAYTCQELGVCHGRPGPGCICQHDTQHLPAGGYYFAPGAIEDGGPRRARLITGWRRVVLDIIVVLAVSGLIGFCAGVLQAKGWPL